MLTIQDARRIAKGFMRAQEGADWWKGDDEVVRARKAAIGKAARLILAEQAQTPASVAKVDTPPAPAGAQVPAILTVTPDEARLTALRVQAHQVFPSDPTQSSKTKHNKTQADKRRRFLVAHGAPRVEPKEGHTAFGRKLVGGEWVKL